MPKPSFGIMAHCLDWGSAGTDLLRDAPELLGTDLPRDARDHRCVVMLGMLGAAGPWRVRNKETDERVLAPTEVLRLESAVAVEMSELPRQLAHPLEHLHISHCILVIAY